MKIVYLNYFYSAQYVNPENWLQKIKPITAVLEVLAKNNTVISIEQIDYQGQMQVNGIDFRFVNFYKSKTFFPFKLNIFVKQLKPNIVIVHGTLFPLQTILLRLILGRNVRIVIQHHAEYPSFGMKKILQKTASYIVDAYFFPSKNIGKIWQDKGNIQAKKPIFSIHEGTSTFKSLENSSIELGTSLNNGLNYIWVGRLDANKNPLLAIKAFAKFLAFQPNAKLYMLFYKDELLEEITAYLAENQQFGQKIMLVGKVDHNDMPNWYSKANFYISTSFKEGTSFTLSEAMSCGCLPIVTNIPTHIEMTGNACGILYKAGSEDELVNALIQSVTLPITIEKEKAIHQFFNHLSANAIAKAIEKAITELR